MLFTAITKKEWIENNKKMDVLNFLTGNGLFLILAIVLIVVYIINRNRGRRR